MPGYNFNHFTGKTKSGNTRKNRKKKERKTKAHTNKYEKYSNQRWSNREECVERRGEITWIIAVLITGIIVLLIRLFSIKIRFKAFIYFIVDKGYTEPTHEEMVQCIKIVIQKTIEDWAKRYF